MLDLPQYGFQRSVQRHNVDLTIMSDWIEASVLFVEEKISKSDVVDVLSSNEIYTDQDFAAEMIDNVWVELDRRAKWMGMNSSFHVRDRRVQRMLANWQDNPAHSFCLVLALSRCYPRWARQFGSDYTVQGLLFERLTLEALQKLGWTVHRTGWSGAVPNNNTDTVIRNVADCLNERVGDITRWREVDSKDVELDLVCYKPFVDGRGGKPIYLVQCASGANWERKLHTPQLSVWKKLVDFSNEPQRALAMPFTLEDDPFRRACNRVEGMLIDRCRLLSAGHDDRDWMPGDLGDELVAWTAPRIASLPGA